MRRVLFILLILNGMLLPLSCVPVLFLLNVVNPMQMVFVTAFTVENRTAATIYVTPVGTVGPDGWRRPLPLAVWQAPWVPASQRGRIPIGSGETITLYYDWDDINFSELVVETEGGTLRQLIVNPNPTANQYTIPRVTDFVIDDVAQLGPVDLRVQEAYDAAQRPIPFWLILTSTAAPAVTFVLLRRWYKSIQAPAVPRPS